MPAKTGNSPARFAWQTRDCVVHRRFRSVRRRRIIGRRARRGCNGCLRAGRANRARATKHRRRARLGSHAVRLVAVANGNSGRRHRLRRDKIGLLPDVASIAIVAEFLDNYRHLPVVIDPVLAPTRGQSWSDEATHAALLRANFPLATMLTPNVPEAQILGELEIGDASEMEFAARQLRAQSGRANRAAQGRTSGKHADG